MAQLNSKLQAKLSYLETLDHRALSAEWKRLNGVPPPKASSRKFLMRALAYELQSKSLLNLSKADQKILSSYLMNRDTRLSPTPKANRPTLKLDPGSKLMREWNGKNHIVSVIEEGFIYKDKVWNSLSAIAKDITGAHWSGPRFFGLNRAQS